MTTIDHVSSGVCAYALSLLEIENVQKVTWFFLSHVIVAHENEMTQE
jgi:hypothetical protein